jgi:flagellar P-ring protein precursor FlgI
MLASIMGLSVMAPAAAVTARIKDITSVQGLRDHYLIGYGIVAGLPSNSGDRNNLATDLAQINMLKNFGIDIKEFLTNNQVDVKNINLANPGQGIVSALRQLNGGGTGNIAAVMITAKVAPYSKEGDKFDIDVSSFGSSRNLAGGVLLQTLLKGPDGKVYAAAQGPVIAAGYEVEANGSMVREGSPNSGRVPAGGMIEFPMPSTIDINDGIILTTEKTDFTTTKKIADAISSSAYNRVAEVVDGRTIKVKLNGPEDNPVTALAEIGALTVDTENVAKVVIMERTGTIIVGEDVRLAPVAIAHGSLSITIKTNNNVSQPFVQTLASLNTAGDNTNINSSVGGSNIQTQTYSNSNIELNRQATKYVEMQESTTLAQLVQELNKVGVDAKDLIAIMQALKASGALQAELVII